LPGPLSTRLRSRLVKNTHARDVFHCKRVAEHLPTLRIVWINFVKSEEATKFLEKRLVGSIFCFPCQIRR
jgi:hypothetical protein